MSRFQRSQVCMAGLLLAAGADACALATGSPSPLVVQPLGIRLPIYPAKGCSVTMAVKDAAMAHQVSQTDDEYKLVFSRLGERLRIAGTAEFNG